MSLILSLETADRGSSVALHEAGHLLCTIDLVIDRSAAEMLTTAISQCLFLTGKSFEELSAIAVSKGPGSYTGLRIGISTAKGLCFAKDLPLVSVNTLDILEAEVRAFNPHGVICPMLDARRKEVYCKIIDGNNRELLPTSAVVLEDNSFAEFLNAEKVLFCGPGAEKAKELILHENAVFLSAQLRPKASMMGALAFKKFENGELENVADFEPFYLKEFMGTVPTKNKKVVAP